MSLPCSRCATPVDAELPPDTPRLVAGILARSVCCDDCGAKAEAYEREQEQRQRDQTARRRLLDAGVPGRLRELTWEQVEPGAAAHLVDAAKRWATGRLCGLLLAGPVGVGKTWLAAAAARQRCELGALRWLSVPTLLAELSLDWKNPRHQRAAEALSGRHALVLDDIDKARPTDYGAEQLFCAVDSRWSAGTPLLVTSNLDLAKLAGRYPQPHGEAIASRLAQHCDAYVIEGSDRRLEVVR